jgi:peptide/nickel transport system permease protein
VSAFAGRLLAGTTARIAAAILLVLLILAVLGGVLAPHDPLAQDVGSILKGPSSGHLLGTDYLGRDTFSRLIAGTQVTLLSALAMVAIGVLAGALPGIASAFLHPAAEFAVMRSVDALLSLPTIILAIAIAGLFSDGALAAILAVGVLLAPRFFRIARAETLGFAHQQYVEAAELMGASRTRIVRSHIIAKVLPTVAVTAAISGGYAVLAVSSLSFLGLGVQPPAPTWGAMLASDVQYLYQSSLAPIWPGIAIVATAWAFNSLADALRAALRPGVRPGLLEQAVTPESLLLADQLEVGHAS